jgi:hypothetical protein
MNPDGRREIAKIAGVKEDDSGNILTQSEFAAITESLPEREGVQAALEIIERLVQYGYESVQASGASMSPFIGASFKPSKAPDGDDPARWEVYTEELAEKILSSTDYVDQDMGPQLLDARARPWGKRSLPMVVGVRGVVMDAGGKTVVVRHNYSAGLTPQEMYACVAGARQGFAQLHTQSEQMINDALKRGSPTSLNVLSRARRSRHPGIVFARAAASGEVDPLTEIESRIITGIS